MDTVMGMDMDITNKKNEQQTSRKYTLYEKSTCFINE